MKDKAYIVPSFHHDIAYLRTENYYTERAMDIIDMFLDIAEKYDEYRFFIEQACRFYKPYTVIMLTVSDRNDTLCS